MWTGRREPETLRSLVGGSWLWRKWPSVSHSLMITYHFHLTGRLLRAKLIHHACSPNLTQIPRVNSFSSCRFPLSSTDTMSTIRHLFYIYLKSVICHTGTVSWVCSFPSETREQHKTVKALFWRQLFGLANNNIKYRSQHLDRSETAVEITSWRFF